MQVLVLGPQAHRVAEATGEEHCTAHEGVLSEKILQMCSPEVVVSFGYRYVIPPDLLNLIHVPVFNLHISLLPWNRGSDPNLWSWLENTPRGVSIHWLSAGLDEGHLLAQQQFDIDPAHTLRTSYEFLTDQILLLLARHWGSIAERNFTLTPQPPGGTYHRSADKAPHAAALTNGWDTPCGSVLEYGERHGLWVTHERPQ